MLNIKSTLARLLAASLIAGGAGIAHAETKEVRIAQQFGIGYLPLMYLQNDKLLEKHAKALGIDDVKVTWSRFAGGSVMIDALLSDSLDFASSGVGPAITLWAKTSETPSEVKIVTAMNSMPIFLNTNNPNIKSIKDFTDKDKIALPGVKVSIQAVTLQIAAEQAFGVGHHDKLDKLTVSLSHPDGLNALLSGQSEIPGHFTAPPFSYKELKQPGIHRILNSYDVLGGPATFNVITTTSKFRQANPKLYRAFLDAFKEAIDLINQDRRAAAELYLKVSNDKKTTVDEVLAILNDPDIEFTQAPKNITKYSDFLFKIGSIKHKPNSWKDLFFPEIHHLSGS